MKTLYRIFSEEVPRRLRRRVITEVVNVPLTHGQWVSSEGCGCLFATAATAAWNGDVIKNFGNQHDPDRRAASMLGIKIASVEEGRRAWDSMTDGERRELLDLLNHELTVLTVPVPPPQLFQQLSLPLVQTKPRNLIKVAA